MNRWSAKVCDITQTKAVQPPISVDVVIPCYNYGWCLRNCVESVLGQTGVNVRVLIIDDASTDNTAQLAAEFSSTDPRVENRVHSVNHGHIKTYNEGLEWASSPYTVLLSADDMLTPGSLRRACDLLEAYPKVGFVYGRPLLFHDDNSLPQPKIKKGRWKIWRGQEWFAIRCDLTTNCICSPEVVMRSSLLHQVGGFREELPHTADFEMWMRLALHSDVGYVQGPHQAWYRDHPMAMHHHQFGTTLADLTQIWTAFQVLFHDYAQMIPHCQHLEKNVRRRLAHRALLAACRAYDSGIVNRAEVVKLEDLATTIYGDAHTLSVRRGLQWRKWLGSGLCRILAPCFVLTHTQRLCRKFERWHLHRLGLL